ncbi:MAG: hypothetical protein IJ130_06110 [Solobacterium sp.]|nr:hypothetical protein [Solobacterium sp.]
MKKIWPAACVLLLAGCASLQSNEPHPFRIAVIDSGNMQSQLTWYDADLNETGRTELDGKTYVSYSGNHSEIVRYDGQNAYLVSNYDRPENVRNYGIAKVELGTGRISIIPTEVKPLLDIFPEEGYLTVLQWDSGSSGVSITRASHVRTDGSGGELLDLRFPWCSIMQTEEGYLFHRTAGNSQYVFERYSRDFQLLESRETEADMIAAGWDWRWNIVSRDYAEKDRIVYAPVQRENHRLKEVDEGVFESEEFLGYSYGLMVIDTESLDHHVLEYENYSMSNPVVLKNGKILMSGHHVELNTRKSGGAAYYSYVPDQNRLILLDPQTERFETVTADFEPELITADEEFIMILDTDNTIHLMDPDDLHETACFRHTSRSGHKIQGLIVSRPSQGGTK